MSQFEPWPEYKRKAEAEWFAKAKLGLEESYVYRYFDAEDRLLYVGQTIQLNRRHSQHRSKARWFPLATRRDVSGPYTKDVALGLEFVSIHTEDPLHNRTRQNGYTGPGSLAWEIALSQEFQRRLSIERDYHVHTFAKVLDIFAAMRHPAA